MENSNLYLQPKPQCLTELAEAFNIINELSSHVGSMKPIDRRFWVSWRHYLDRVGNEARVGKWRIQHLRKLWADYGEVKDHA